MADWIRRIGGVLRLARSGFVLLVEHARTDHLRSLLAALEPTFGEVNVCLEPSELEALPPGALVVYAPAPAHAAELNAGRPLFADRRLRVLLWCEGDVSVRLAQEAPDFFDWISHRVECPGGMATFFRQGLKIARAVGVGGVIAVLPNVQDVEPWLVGIASLPVELHGDEGPVWELRLALALERAVRLPVALRERGEQEPGWWLMDVAAWPSLRQAVGDAQPPLLTRHVAWLGGEKEAIRLVRRLVDRLGRGNHAKLLDRVVRSPARLLHAVLRHGLFTEEDIRLGLAPAPLLRAAFATNALREKRSLVRWEGAASAPVAWQAVFAPARLSEATVYAYGLLDKETRRGTLEVLLRAGDFRGILDRPPCIRVIGGIGDLRLRADIQDRLIEAADPRDRGRDLLLRAQRLMAADDVLSCAVLLDLAGGWIAYTDDPALALDFTAEHVRALSLTGRYNDASCVQMPDDRASLIDVTTGRARSLRALAPESYIRVWREIALNSLRQGRRDEAVQARRLIERCGEEVRTLSVTEQASVVEIAARLALVEGRTDRAERELARPAAGALGLTANVLMARIRWLQGRSREGLDVLGDPSLLGRASLPTRLELVAVWARCAVDAGMAEAALELLERLLPEVGRGLGERSPAAAELWFLTGEAHLALGAYERAKAMYERAADILRGDDDRELPDRFQVNLALKVLPGTGNALGAQLALDDLARRMAPGHPLVERWRRRVDALQAPPPH